MRWSLRPDGACRRWRTALWMEVDGALAGGDRQSLLAHLEECSRCRLHLEVARRLDAALAASATEAPRPGFEERILLGIASGMANVDPRTSPAPAQRPRTDRATQESGDWWVLGGGLAAAALVGIAAVSLVPRLAMRAAVAAAAEGSSPAGGPGLLTRGFRAMTLSSQEITSLIQSPLFWPAMLTFGVVAFTLAGIRFAFSRPEPAARHHTD